MLFGLVFRLADLCSTTLLLDRYVVWKIYIYIVWSCRTRTEFLVNSEDVAWRERGGGRGWGSVHAIEHYYIVDLFSFFSLVPSQKPSLTLSLFGTVGDDLLGIVRPGWVYKAADLGEGKNKESGWGPEKGQTKVRNFPRRLHQPAGFSWLDASYFMFIPFAEEYLWVWWWLLFACTGHLLQSICNYIPEPALAQGKTKSIEI